MSPVRVSGVADAERRARRRLPKPVFDVVAGGAGDEWTMERNVTAFRTVQLRPRIVPEDGPIDLSTRVLGTPASLPLILSPTGWQRMVHRDAESAVARAAGRAGVPYALSTVTSVPLEEVAAAADGPRWFQLYIRRGPDGPERTADLVRRAAAAGFSALVVTVDTAVVGNRDRDVRNRLTLPFRLTPSILAHCAVRPRWAADFVRGGVGRGDLGGSVSRRALAEAGSTIAASASVVTRADLERIRELWSGPLLVKGVLGAEDWARIEGVGVEGVVVSNHGGRQLDGLPATIEVLPEVVAAVAGRAAVLLDSGVRRGIDIVRALALGADACMIGRPYLYGLAADGEDGVVAVIEAFRREFHTALALLGRRNVEEIDRSCLRPVEQGHPSPSG